MLTACSDTWHELLSTGIDCFRHRRFKWFSLLQQFFYNAKDQDYLSNKTFFYR